jgi:hypothetical protein
MMDEKLAAKYIAIRTHHGYGDEAKLKVEIARRHEAGETYKSIALDIGRNPQTVSMSHSQLERELNRMESEGVVFGTPLKPDDPLHLRGELSMRARRVFSHAYGGKMTAELFCQTPPSDMVIINEFGRKSISDVAAFVREHGFTPLEDLENKSYNVTTMRQVHTIISNLGWRVVDENGNEIDLKGVA